MTMFLLILWATGVLYHLIWSTLIYRRYFRYAYLALKRDWSQGFNQSQNWFWDNGLLCVESLFPPLWIWRCRKASERLDSVIQTYPIV